MLEYVPPLAIRGLVTCDTNIDRRSKVGNPTAPQYDTSGEAMGLKRNGGGIEMLRLGNRIRLTRREVERFTEITGFEPVGVKTLDELDAYIAKCKRHYWGVSKETRYLHWLIDQEKSRCLGAA